MSDEFKRGFFRRKEAPVQNTQKTVSQVRTAVPDMTQSPDPITWAEYSTSTISVREALQIPEVAAAHRLITTAVSQLGMVVERQGVEIPSALATRPDMDRSQSNFFKRTTTDLCLYGNAFWRLFRNGDGAVVDMKVLDPTRVRVRYNDNGQKFYEYADDNGSVTLSNNLPNSNGGQVEHIRLAELPGYVEGLGPIQMNNAALAAIKNQHDYYQRFLDDSKRPSGLFSFDSELDPEDQAHTLEVIKSKIHTGEPFLLGKGGKYQTFLLNAEQTALVEMKAEASRDVARIFGIPPYKLAASVEGNSMTYSNVSQADRAWVRESLEEYLTAIEDAMTNVLPRGQVAAFDTENWLRAAEAIEIQTKEAATEGAA